MSMAEYPVRLREPLPPNESATMPFRVSRAGRFVDLVGLPPDVVVTKASLSRVRYDREEMKASFGEFLALEPQDVKAGTYCGFTVTNLGSKPADVTGKVLVENEHGDAVQGLREVTASVDDEPVPEPRSMPREASRRNPANDAMVDAIIDNATMADGTPMSKAKSKSNKQRTGSSSGAAARRPMPAPAVVPLARSVKPQKIMTRHARRKHYEAEASARATSSGVIDACDVLLHAGHVAMLDLALSACVPLADGVREEIGAALRDAREGVRTDGVGVVVVRLSDDDCERLLEALDARVEYTLGDTEAMCAAVKEALEGAKVDASAAAAPPTTDTAMPAVTDTSTSADAAPPASKSLVVGEDSSALDGNKEVGNVTPIHGKVQDDGRPQSRPGALVKSVVNEV